MSVKLQSDSREMDGTCNISFIQVIRTPDCNMLTHSIQRMARQITNYFTTAGDDILSG